MNKRVDINRLSSGVPGLDEVLGGGFPEYSFNLIAGAPGAGKTTLAQQIMFAGASRARGALYITIVGEPPIKMLRYQQQYSFFDSEKIPGCVRFLHLAGDVFESGLAKVLESIIREVEATSPKMVFVDSFRAIVRKSSEPGEMDLQDFVQRLCLHLTNLEATTFLVGEYEDQEKESSPIFSVADGLIWLSQVTHRSSVLRKLQVVKMRGQASLPGLHTMQISGDGVRVHPRLTTLDQPPLVFPSPRPRQKTGIAGLDEMLGGGVPAGYFTLLVGPTGSGKTTVASHFICEGIEREEKGLIVVFEKRPAEYLSTHTLGERLAGYLTKGMLKVLHPRPIDLSIDETMAEIESAVRETGAKRVVIDSLSSLELALAPTFREEFRESLYRMVGQLARLGVTIMMTAEIVDAYGELRLSPPVVSSLVDGLILQRYVEIDGSLRRVLNVVKLRGLEHSKKLKLYEIGAEGITVGHSLPGYQGILGGAPRYSERSHDLPEE